MEFFAMLGKAKIMKNIFLFWSFAFLTTAFAQLPTVKMLEAYGDLHNLFCLKYYKDLNSEEDIAKRFPYYYEIDRKFPILKVKKILFYRFPGVRPYIQSIDSLINLCEELPRREFFLRQKNLQKKVIRASELTDTEKSLLLYMLSVLKHSYQLWGDLLPNNKQRAVLTADAYGAVKGILAGLLFFAIYDFTRQPTRIGLFGGIGLALAVPAISSLVAGIKYKGGSAGGGYYYID